MVGAREGRLSGWRIFRRVLREQDSHWPHFAGILALSILVAPLSLLPPLAMKIAVDSYLGGAPLPALLDALVPAAVSASAFGDLIVAAGLIVIVAVLVQALRFAKKVLQAYTREKLVLGFRMRLFPHVERLSLDFHDQRGASDSTFRVLFDTAVIPAVLLDGMIPMVAAFISLVVMTTVVVMISWKLAAVALVAGPVLLLISWPFRRRLRRQWHRVKELDSAAMAVLQEVFSAVRVIKAFGKEQQESERLLGVARAGMRARVRVAVTQGQFRGLMTIFGAAGKAAVLFVGAWQVKSGALSLGEMVMAAALLVQVYTPLQLIVGQITALQSSLASAERALGLLDEVPAVVDRAHARKLEHCQGRVAFCGVTFGYEEGQTVLRDISFEVASGQRIGIAGPTGAGKTTLMNLLTRLYDPRAGVISLDEIDLREIKLDDLRSHFSIVLQEPVLFKTTIAENINYARPGAGMEETIAAARLAGAHEFIRALPQGYETVPGERGMRLSGGERQRISLARAFLKDAPILILDEPTSSVDMKTEAAILDALGRLMKGRTTFIIAHRPSTLRDCDKVLLIEAGRVAAFAPPAELGPLESLLLGTAS